MSNYYVISAPGAPQPEMRGSAEEKAPGQWYSSSNAPGYPDHIGTVKYSSLSELKVLKSVGPQY
jgi:hypothetical protein